MMQIEFIQATDVDNTAIPRSAWGKLQRRVTLMRPSFETMAMEPVSELGPEAKPTEKQKAVTGPMVWYFRIGAIVELPDDMASEFIASGAAKPAQTLLVVQRDADHARLKEVLE